MTHPLVSVGIVTWKSAAKLPPTLDAIARQDYPNIQLILVDNASSDNSVALVREHFPDAQIIQNHENCGFCEAHNQAIQGSDGEYYLALNPDVLMSPNYISSLVDALEHKPDFGSAAGKLLREPGVIDTTGLFINRRRQQYLRGHAEPDQGQYDMPGEVFGVDGAAPLFRRAMLEDIREGEDYFDRDFFAYKEDVDLAWRSRWLAWRSWYEPRAVALHPRSFQPGNRRVGTQVRFYSVRNRYFLLMKNECRAGWRRDALRILYYDLQIVLYLLLRERESLGALSAAWRLRHRMRQKHMALMARRRMSPAAMLEWFR